MKRKKPHFIWVVLAYLIPLLFIVALATLAVVVWYERPGVGDSCRYAGEVITREQDGRRLQCVRNSDTGKQFWLPAEPEEEK